MKPLFAIAAIALCGLTAQAGPTIHALIVVDTLDNQIGTSVGKDRDKWRKLFLEVTGFSALDLTFQEYLIEGSTFSDSSLQSSLDALTVGTDDVIFFCYGGHGHRFANEELPWPALKMNTAESRMNEITWKLVDVFQQLAAKNPRLLIALADCCNNKLPDKYEKYYPLHSRAAVPRRLLSDQYRSLFIDATGSYIASGCSPGEFSWGTTLGGYFTEQFIDSLHKTTENLDVTATRETVLTKATVLITQTGSDTTQQPIFAANPVFP